jgi:hypothetical protein
LAILRAFAKALQHPSQSIFEQPFVLYVGNQPPKARDHFYGLHEGKKDLVGFALFDRDVPELTSGQPLVEYKWKQREFENYLCQKETLMSYAESLAKQESSGPLFDDSQIARTRIAMEDSIRDIEKAMATLGKGSPWSPDAKVSDDFLDPLFGHFFKRLGLPNLMNKSNFHELARHVPPEIMDTEIRHVLDVIQEVYSRRVPEGEKI